MFIECFADTFQHKCFLVLLFLKKKKHNTFVLAKMFAIAKKELYKNNFRRQGCQN